MNIQIAKLCRPAIVVIMGLSLMSWCALAQDYDDPPSRVARLSYAQGDVSFSPAGTDDWVEAMVNRPLTTGDALWSGSRSRAALHIGSASIHLSEFSSFSFLNLTDDAVQIQLNSGALRIRVKRLGDYENFEVDTPNLAFSILRPGIYRISVSEDGFTTVVEDRRGEGEVTGGGLAYNLHSGDVGRFSGVSELSADMQSLGDLDDFERWSEQRDHHEDVSISARYVSDDAIGYDDLDDNGGWRPVPAYGMVWFPRAIVYGWAPYHYGHWAYVPPWGYTWVDDAPWGFSPFHYGRWVVVDGAWGWVPCPPRPPTPSPVYVRPVYAPALVAWIGGPHFGIGIAVGSVGIGWFPLGPREVYMPSYPVSRNYVNRVNVSNTTVNTTVVNNYYTSVVVNKTVNITNVTYVNQRVPGAVAATTRQAFSSGQPIARNVVRVDEREVAAAPVNALTPPEVPQRQALLGARPAAIGRPPAAVQARVIVAKTVPPPPPPSFAQRQSAIQSNGGRPLSLAQVRQITPVQAQMAARPQVRVAPAAKVVTAPRQTEAAKQYPPQNQNAAERPHPPAVSNAGRPAPQPVNEELQQRHQQQVAALRQQQDQERQQLAEHQKKQIEMLQQQRADGAKKQAAQQQHQQQLQELQQKHQEQLKNLQAKQEAERRQEEQKKQQ